jgi:ferritin-like metal-binding protein YciE
MAESPARRACRLTPTETKSMKATLKASDVALKIYTSGLRNQHAVENQAIELLERQVGRLENYPAMRERMRQHIEESREQARRLDELLDALDTSASSFKDTAMSFMGNMAALAHTPASDEVMKNSFANFAFEHYEIASYGALITIAETVQHQEAVRLLAVSLKEEQAMAQWIADHLAETTRTFLQRSEQGQTAGV